MNQPTNLSDFVFSATEIATFDFYGRNKRIWALTNNRPESPQTWQFRYEPLFSPEISTNNQLSVKSEQWIGSSWKTTLTILLDDKDAREFAYQTVCNVFPDYKFEIQQSSIFVLPVRDLKINIPDIKEVDPVCRIIKDSFEFSGLPEEFTIKIESPDKETALKIEKFLPSMTLDYEYSVSTRKSQQNSTRFSINKLKNSTLYTKLSGFGNVVYVHRDDLRKLIEGINTQIYFDSVIEKPEKFKSLIYYKLLDRWSQINSSKDFDENKWQSTYNRDDLKPNILTKELNKLFTKEQNDNEWKINPSVELNAEPGALEQIKGKVAGKLSISNEALKKLLRENSIEVNTEGTKIEVKSINLHQVNLADFNDDIELINNERFVQPSEVKSFKGYLEFSRFFLNKGSNEKKKKIALLGEINVGKSTILESLTKDNILSNQEKLPWIFVEIPDMMSTYVNKKFATAKFANADGLIFIINDNPSKKEMELFNIVNEKLHNIPKIVFVNKWDKMQNSHTKKDQDTIRAQISEKIGKFVKSPEDIVYGSAMLLDKKRDEMIRQELTQLINKIREIF
jgi:GTP-binding protein EngB required for normal cell division